MNTLYFVGIAVIVILYIIISIRNNKLSIYNSSICIIFCLALLILSIWPKSLDWLANLIGIDYNSNVDVVKSYLFNKSIYLYEEKNSTKVFYDTYKSISDK